MLRMAKRLWNEEEGQGMVEYGLIIALVAIVVIGALGLVGDTVIDTFNDIVAGLTGQEL